MNNFVTRSLSILLLFFSMPSLSQEYERSSVITLIASPSAKEGMLVMISGYLKIRREGDAIYLGKEHADHALTKNAIWLELTASQAKEWKILSDHYVVVYGKFTEKLRGHGDLYSGSLVDVYKIYKLPDYQGG